MQHGTIAEIRGRVIRRVMVGVICFVGRWLMLAGHEVMQLPRKPGTAGMQQEEQQQEKQQQER
jgi:hypothetical protein